MAPKTPSLSDDAKSDILSQDVLVYLTHLEEAINEIEESDEKTIIQEWLVLLLGNPYEDAASVRIGNMALSELLMNIEQNKLRFPFNERPSQRSYKHLVDRLKSALEQNANLENGDEGNFDSYKDSKNRDMDVNEFEDFTSMDNRTYVAIRTLSNGGLFGYIAVTVGDADDAHWLDSKGCPMVTPVPSELRVEQIKSPPKTLEMPNCSNSEIKMVWHTLKNRKPAAVIIHSYDFYKMLYATVEQEIMAESCIPKCTQPFINKLLKFLEIDMKASGVTNLKLFHRVKLLSILKRQIKRVLSEIENRNEKLECAINVVQLSVVVSLPPRCCYNFVSSTLWHEISQQRPGTKYMDILSREYPEYFFPKYFSVLVREKQLILTNLSAKYCKILDEMFADIGNSIAMNMKKYRDAKWEWHLVHEIIDAYCKERTLKDKLCVAGNSADDSTDSFFEVIYNEINMAQDKLKTTVAKNNLMIEQLPKLKNDLDCKHHTYKSIMNQNQEKWDKYKNEINNEKRDIMKREASIAELQRKALEVEGS